MLTVGSALRPRFFSGSEMVSPSASRGTMKASRAPLLRAVTRKWLARSPIGTKHLAPESTKSEPFGSATVRGSAGSKSGVGSTRARVAAW